MNKLLLSAAIILCVGFIACTTQKSSEEKTQKVDSTNEVKNLISIVEIPTTDFSRAVLFYQGILGIVIEEVDLYGIQMGVFPGDGETVNVVLVKGDEYKPTTDGTVVYLNGGDDLQIVLDKIESNGGRILVPKTEISTEMGFFAMFTDSEGNKLGLHSKK